MILPLRTRPAPYDGTQIPVVVASTAIDVPRPMHPGRESTGALSTASVLYTHTRTRSPQNKIASAFIHEAGERRSYGGCADAQPSVCGLDSSRKGRHHTA